MGTFVLLGSTVQKDPLCLFHAQMVHILLLWVLVIAAIAQPDIIALWGALMERFVPKDCFAVLGRE